MEQQSSDNPSPTKKSDKCNFKEQNQLIETNERIIIQHGEPSINVDRVIGL
jgi:hypothetical protein